MKIFATSDLHDKQMIECLCVPVDAEVIVLAGDLEYPEFIFERLSKPERPIIAVAGNHDFYGRDIADGVEYLRELAKQYINIHILENDTVDINGIRFIGSTFWSNYGRLHPRLVVEAQYNMTDATAIQAEKWWQNEANERFALTLQDYMLERFSGFEKHQLDAAILPYLKNINKTRFHPFIGYQLNQKAICFITSELAKPFSGKKVVITHHPPTWTVLEQIYGTEIDANLYNDWRFTPPGYDQVSAPYGIPEAVIASNYGSDLASLFNTKGDGLSGSDCWIHGHTHYNVEYALNGTRFINNALGRYTCPIEKIESKQILLSDGLRYAFEQPISQLESALTKQIEQLEAWSVCEEIEQLNHILIREAILDRLDAHCDYAKQALTTFVAALNKGLPAKAHLSVRSLFDIQLNTRVFYVSLFEKHPRLDDDTDHYDPSMLTRDHITDEMNKLKHIRDLITSESWLVDLINQGK